jgi:hypothetical protein
VNRPALPRTRLECAANDQRATWIFGYAVSPRAGGALSSFLGVGGPFRINPQGCSQELLTKDKVRGKKTKEKMASRWQYSFCRIIITIAIVVELCHASSILNLTIELANTDFCWNTVSKIKNDNPADPRLYYPKLPYDENLVMMRLPDCKEVCGAGPVFYRWLDVYQRIDQWIIPLAILIGTTQTAELGLMNKIRVVLQLLANPFAAVACLLSKLALNQSFHELAVSKLPSLDPATQKAFAVVLASYEEWENCIVEKVLSSRRGGVNSIEGLLETQETDLGALHGNFRRGSAQERLERLIGQQDYEPVATAQLHDAYVRASHCCRLAALTASHGLSNCRSKDLSKAFIGIITYVTSFSLSFVQIYQGNFNRRTGGSIALALLYMWIVPAVLLSTLVGEFTNKRLTRVVLEKLEKDLGRVEEETLQAEMETLQDVADGFQGTIDQLLDQLENIRRHMGYNPFLPKGSMPWLNINEIRQTISRHPSDPHDTPRRNLVGEGLGQALKEAPRRLRDAQEQRSIFHFSRLGPDSSDPYFPLCYSGGNYAFRPSRCCSRIQKRFILAAVVPVFMSVAAACMLLWTLPPPSFVNCKMVKDVAFFVTWGLSLGLDALPLPLRMALNMEEYWRVVSWKNFVIFLLQFGMVVVVSLGLFNSCTCWSNYLASPMSPGEAYVIFDPEVVLRTTSRTIWPTIVGTLLALSVAYVGVLFLMFRKGATLYDRGQIFLGKPLDQVINGVKLDVRGEKSVTAL